LQGTIALMYPILPGSVGGFRVLRVVALSLILFFLVLKLYSGHSLLAW
jgi:hypothetical protein